MLKKRHLNIVFILLLMIIISTSAIFYGDWIIYHKSAFKGKVIDSETKEPIEGAVVAAIYSVRVRGPLELHSDIADVQETLTDSNGEYNVPSNTFFYFSPFARNSGKTRFIVFKPGYGTYPGNYSFFIYPVPRTIRKDNLQENILNDVTNAVVYPTSSAAKKYNLAEYKNNTMEGIVFKKRMTDKVEKMAYNKKFGANYEPFIQLKNPFEKVQSLELPFDADVMNARRALTVGTKPFKSYPVIGIPKLKIREERIKSHSSAGRIPDGFTEKVPIWKKMLDDEYNYLFKEGH